MSVSPQLTSNLDRVDADLLPPCPLIADAMNRPVMDPAQGGNEFVAHLPTECTRLHEAQVVGIGWLSPAHETGLLGDEPEMLFIAIATRPGNRQRALVDSPGRIISLATRPSLLGRGRLCFGTSRTRGLLVRPPLHQLRTPQ